MIRRIPFPALSIIGIVIVLAASMDRCSRANAQTAITIDAADLRKLEQNIQTTNSAIQILSVNQARLIELINEWVKRQAEKDKTAPPAQ